jgi:hypothetical protein
MVADGKPGLPMSTMTRSWRGVVVPITTPKEMRIVAEDGGLCFAYHSFCTVFPLKIYCLKESIMGVGKAYSTPGK